MLDAPDPERPVYRERVEPLYAEINRLYEEMLAESKRLAEALYAKRQELRGSWELGRVSWTKHQEERVSLKPRHGKR